MKKIFAFLILALLVSAGNVFAAAETVGDSDNPSTGGHSLYAVTPDDTLIGKMSKGVKITARTSLTNYSIYTAHTSGSKKYGSAADSTSIFNSDYTSGTALPTPSVVGVAEFATGWTSL